MSTILVIDDQAISRMILQELVRSVDEDVEVQSFADPVKGKELALAQVDKGAAVLYHAAGLTGAGVFEAAKERKTFVIGVGETLDSLNTIAAAGGNAVDGRKDRLLHSAYFQYCQMILGGQHME